MAKLRIEWIRSAIGRPERHKRTIEAIGLKRIHHVVEHDDTPQIRGIVTQVHHLVRWSVVEK